MQVIAQWLERLTADQRVPDSSPGVLFNVLMCTPFADATRICAGVKCETKQVPHFPMYEMSGHPKSNQGPSDCCRILQSDAPPIQL